MSASRMITGNGECGRGSRQARKKGELEKTIRLARKKRTKGLTAEETAELLEEDAALIQKIYGCMEMHPEWEGREDRGKYAGGFCKDLSRNRKSPGE